LSSSVRRALPPAQRQSACVPLRLRAAGNAPVASPPIVAPVPPQTGSAITSAANNPWLRRPAPGRAGAADGMRSLILHSITRLLSKGQNVSVLTQGYAKVRGLLPLCPAAEPIALRCCAAAFAQWTHATS